MDTTETFKIPKLTFGFSKADARSFYLGRHVLGLAAILFGIFTLSWRDFNIWEQIRPLGNTFHRQMLACIAGGVELFGGLALSGIEPHDLVRLFWPEFFLLLRCCGYPVLLRNRCRGTLGGTSSSSCRKSPAR